MLIGWPMARLDANAVRGPHVVRDQTSGSHPGSGHILHQHRLCFRTGTHGHSRGPLMPSHVDLATSRKGWGAWSPGGTLLPQPRALEETLHPLEEAD